MDVRICQAIAERRLLMLGYKGVMRVVEPHLYGVTTTGHEALSAWMRSGWSRLDPDGGWRLFHTDAFRDLQVLPEEFHSPRPGFNPGDSHFAEVFCHVAARPAASPPAA